MRGVIEHTPFAPVPDVTSDGRPNITVTADSKADETAFFGEDGPSFRDVLDAINPLNHIPIVSGLMEEATGHKVSVAAKLAGGALLGPIGFIASLANVIFEQQTGKDVIGTAYAALTGDAPGATQLANAEGVTPPEQVAQAGQTALAMAPAEATDPNAALKAKADAMAKQQLAALTTPVTATAAAARAPLSASDPASNQALLQLYGQSRPSAHSAYQKAQLLPYLKQVNASQVL